MNFNDRVHGALAALPTSSLLDRGAVVDVLLDLRNEATEDSDVARVTAAMEQLPSSSIIDRYQVCDLLLDLLSNGDEAERNGALAC